MSWLLAFGILEWTIRLVMVLVILRRRFSPETSLAWLSLVFFLPEVGLVVYLLIGDRRLGRRRVHLYRRVIAAMRTEGRLAGLQAHAMLDDLDSAESSLMLRAEQTGGLPVLAGNDVELLGDAIEVIDRLVADIHQAQHHVHLLFYIYSPDETGQRVAEALIKARQRGVHCRVLADAAGSRQFFARHGLARRLNDHDVPTYPTLPVAPLRRRLARLDLRNHRKLAVIDGRIGYAGSQNIVNADYGHRRAGSWIDLTGRFTGPIVTQLQIVFLEDWAFETGQELDGSDILVPLDATGPIPAQAVPTGPTGPTEALLRVILAAINAAQRKIIITSPYLVPDEPTMLALAMAAERGVQVDLVIPQCSDHPLVNVAGRAYYEPLLEAGVGIHLHRPGLLHAKTMTVDDSFALLGSSNLDIRSFHLNFELNVLLYGPQITREMRFAQMCYLSESEAVNLEQWRQRPMWRQYAQNIAALLSPLL